MNFKIPFLSKNNEAASVTKAKVQSGYIEGTGYNRTMPWKPKPLADFKDSISPSDRQDIVAISRRLFYNSGEIRHIVRNIANFSTNDALYPIFDGTDKEWFSNAERFFYTWTDVCDAGNRLNFFQMLNLISIAIDVDGEIFIILTENEAGFPLIQLIRSHRCKSRNAPEDRNRNIVDGVVLDKQGRPLAYQFTNGTNQTGQEQFYEVSANDVVHLANIETPDQVRGTSNLIHALDAIQRLILMRQYETVSLQMANAIGLIKKTDKGYAEEKVDFDKEQSVESETNSTALNTESFLSGQVNYIGTNEEFIELNKNGRPSDQWQRFTETLVNSACIGLRYPYALLAKQSVAGSVEVRMQLGMLDRTIRERQQLLIVGLNRIWKWLIAKRIKAGKMEAPSDGDFYSIRWSLGKKISVDLGRDASAEINSLRAGTTNYDEIYSNRGLDWKSMLEAKAQEASLINELAKKYGVSPQEIAQLSVNELRPIDNINNNEESK